MSHAPTNWTKQREDRLLLAILDGRMTAEDACRDFGLTTPELESWILDRMELSKDPKLVQWSLDVEGATDRVAPTRSPEREIN